MKVSAAMDMPEREPVSASTIDRLVDGLYPAIALLAGMQLDLFSSIASGASTSREIATAIAGDPAKTRLLLDALVAAGLITKRAGRYALTDEAADHLVATSPWSRVEGHRVLARLWYAALETATSVRLGRAGQPLAYSAMDEQDAEHFLRGLRGDAAALAGALLHHLGLRRGDRIVDVGGGGGGAAATFVDAVDGVTVTVVELSNIAPATNDMLRLVSARRHQVKRLCR